MQNPPLVAILKLLSLGFEHYSAIFHVIFMQYVAMCPSHYLKKKTYGLSFFLMVFQEYYINMEKFLCYGNISSYFIICNIYTSFIWILYI